MSTSTYFAVKVKPNEAEDCAHTIMDTPTDGKGETMVMVMRMMMRR